MEKLQLEIVRNATANGRLFLALLVAINLVVGAHAGATIAALPLGLAYVGDHLTLRGYLSEARALSLVVNAMAVGAAIATLINAW